MPMSNILGNVRRFWWVVIALTLIGAGTGALYQLTQPAAYTSTIRIYVANELADSVPVSQTTNLAVQRMQSYVLLVSSTQLAQRVVDRAGIDGNPNRVADNLRATFDRDTVLMTVTAKASSAVDAEAVVGQVPASMTDLVNSLTTNATASRGAPTEFTTFDGPTTSRTRSLPRLAVSVLFGAILGLGLATAVASLVAARRRGLLSPEELSDATRRPVLGIIPAQDSSGELTAATPVEGSVRWDAYRRLAFNLRVLAPASAKYVVVVTGAAAGVGSSATAFGVASALAASGDDVLLVMSGDVGQDAAQNDPSVETPSDSRATTTPRTPGLTKVALKDEDVDARHTVTELLKKYRDSYDVTVVDAPPVLDGLVTTTLATQADIVLLVADQLGIAPADVVAASDALQAVGGSEVGCVFTGVRPSTVSDSRLRAGLVFAREPAELVEADR